MELVDRFFKLLRSKYADDGEPASNDDVPVDFEMIDDWAWRCGIAPSVFLDEIALRLARAFDAREFSFELCDAVVNDLFGVCFHDRLAEFPRKFWEVYEAFDAGEFHREADESDDPVNEHTRPMIEEILSGRR